MKPYIPARPTTYKGIQMRSRLEADYASALDRDGETWKYEPKCFAGPNGQWLPDFRVGVNVYIEVKPASLAIWDSEAQVDVYTRIDKILTQMTVTWLSEPDALVHLVLWDYGKDQADAPLVIQGVPGSRPLWVAYTPSLLDLPLLWPGMNQEPRL